MITHYRAHGISNRPPRNLVPGDGPASVLAMPTRTVVGPGRAAPAAEVRDALTWTAVVLLGLIVSAVFVGLGLHLGTASAPFTGAYRTKVVAGSVLAPAVAVVVLQAVRRGVHERLGWPALLVGGWLAALLWSLALAVVDGGNGLARPVADPTEYLVDARALQHPVEFVRTFVGQSLQHTVATRQHPPGPVLLLWAIRPLGLVRPTAIGLAITVVGALVVPLVAISVRPVCGELAARRLVPILALAPWAVWTAVSMDAVTSTLCAASICCGVQAGVPHRSRWWAAAAGLLLGVAALFSYSAVWLAATLIAVWFIRRRPVLNVIAGSAALVPLGLARVAGFVWPDGLSAAQVDFSTRIGPHRSWVLWAPLDLLILVIACGPALVPAIRRSRLTPGWPFVVGAALGVGFALLSGLSRGEVERSWLPFFPWLLVPAVAPVVPNGQPGRTPVLLVGLGAAVGVVIEAVLLTAW